jgi:hypothetical protein
VKCIVLPARSPNLNCGSRKLKASVRIPVQPLLRTLHDRFRVSSGRLQNLCFSRPFKRSCG